LPAAFRDRLVDTAGSEIAIVEDERKGIATGEHVRLPAGTPSDVDVYDE
jgi:hypothetical protein